MIAENLNRIHQEIKHYCKQCGRAPDSVHLLAVSKTKPVSLIQEAITAGQRDFGENYVQEALEKIQALSAVEGLQWHFIGPIQSNKTKSIAEHFSWVHSVDRLKIAERLSAQRPKHLPPLNICLQVNIDEEPTKSGVLLSALEALVEKVMPLPNLALKGFMIIPMAHKNEPEQGKSFAKIRETLEYFHAKYHAIDTLSMGMSGDFGAAILEGSTWVRLGTRLFGHR